jgi:hypothetical protein
MRIRLASEFVRKSVSQYRLAVAFSRACPAFAAWCDDAENGLTRRQVVGEIEAAWRSALEVRLPENLLQSSTEPVRYRCTASAVILRVTAQLETLEHASPKADLALKVVCRPGAGDLAFDRLGRLLPQVRERDWLCSIVARITEPGSRTCAAFYDGTVNTELEMG